MNSVCLCTYNRLDHLKSTLKRIINSCTGSYELIIVDDNSTHESGVVDYLKQFSSEIKIPLKIHYNTENKGHAWSQNKCFELADPKSKCLIHIEADILCNVPGWNMIFERFLDDYPEVGLAGPKLTGRGDHIVSPSYRYYTWMVGGLWAIRKSLWDRIGGWDALLQHQLESDYCLRVRLDGGRVAEVNNITMTHLGEGDFEETLKRKAIMSIGVYQFIKKWNQRFLGTPFDYNGVFSMNWDDFPPNLNFRRKAMACLNYNKEMQAVIMPHEPAKVFKDGNYNSEFGWGRYFLEKIPRPHGRTHEKEIARLVSEDYTFTKNSSLLERLRNLANDFNIKLDTDEEVIEYFDGVCRLKKYMIDFDWNYKGSNYRT